MVLLPLAGDEGNSEDGLVHRQPWDGCVLDSQTAGGKKTILSSLGKSQGRIGKFRR